MKIHNNDGKYFVKEKALERLYDDLVTSLMDRLIKRLQKRGTADLIDNPYIWQLEKLNDMHLLTEEVVRHIAKYGRVSEKVLRDVIANEGYQIYLDSHDQLTKALQSNQLPNPLVQESLNAIANQTIGEIDNLLNTTLPVSVQKSYKKTLENAVANVVSGSDSSESAINKAIQSLVEVGFTGFIDKGGRRWTAERYAKTVVKTTTYRVYRDMRERPADELGVDTFYYSVKSSAREMCAPLQHKIVTKGVTRVENGETIYSLLDYGYGKPGGCLGINCGHYLTPFVVGVNEKPTLSEELENLTEEEAIENAVLQAKERAYIREIKRTKAVLKTARLTNDGESEQIQKLKLLNLKQGLAKKRNLRYNIKGHLADKYAKKLLKEVNQVEEIITRDMKTIAGVDNLAGLEFRKKTIDSLSRKIRTDSEDAGVSMKRAAKNINDALRYTTIFDADTFGEDYVTMKKKLYESGYQVIKVKNTWLDNSAYKGVNTVLKKDGITFEMQYHTQESFDLKNGKLHELYEEHRLSTTSVKRKTELEKQMLQLSNRLKVPKGIKEVK